MTEEPEKKNHPATPPVPASKNADEELREAIQIGID